MRTPLAELVERFLGRSACVENRQVLLVAEHQSLRNRIFENFGSLKKSGVVSDRSKSIFRKRFLVRRIEYQKNRDSPVLP